MRFIKFLNKIYIKIIYLYIIITNRNIVFTDMFSQKFFLTKQDNICLYMQRKSITDAINIINYIINNKKEFKVQIDFGCHMGAVSAAMWATASPSGVVYSVDADPYNITKCKTNLKLNGYHDKYVSHAAIAEYTGKIQLRIYDGINGWQTIFGNNDFNRTYKNHFISVPAITFSDFIESNNITQIDLVKIDIEGMEYKLLAQMHSFFVLKIIKEVIFELNELALEPAGKTPSELLALWEQYDYTLYHIEENGDISKLLPGAIPKVLVCDILAKAN